jgi:hypothetical protein
MSLERFAEILIEEGKLKDPSWLDTYFRPTVRKKLLHLARMSYDRLTHSPSVFELFGCDLMLDEDFNIFLIEIVPNPNLGI